MAEEENVPTEDYAEYEILPHKEIKDLKEELAKLKEYEVTPTRKLQVSILELNNKLDRLLSVFEEAMHGIRVEEGGLKFEEKIRPVMERLNKILDQNKDIAEGMIAVADLVKEIKKEGVKSELPPMPKLGPGGMMPPPLPGMAGGMIPGMPPGTIRTAPRPMPRMPPPPRRT